MDELWKDIPGYEGKYQVSNKGRIKSLARTVKSKNQYGEFEWQTKERILSPGKRDSCGHLSVVLHDHNRKSYSIHQLVMQAFLGEPPEGMEVCHNNCDSSDNRIENLRYDTRSENMTDIYKNGKGKSPLTKNDIEAIKFGLVCGMTCCELGLMYGVCHQTISKIKRGEHFSWIK